MASTRHLAAVRRAADNLKRAADALVAACAALPPSPTMLPQKRTLGERVAAARKSLGMSQASLAAAAGCLPSQLCKTEHGKHGLSVHVLLRIAAALRVRPGDLLDGLEADNG